MSYLLKAATFAFFCALCTGLILLAGAPGAPIHFFRYWVAFFMAYTLWDALRYLYK